MTNLPRGYNSKEEYFEDLDRKAKSRKGSFYISLNSHGQTRQDRGTTAGRFGAFMFSAVGDSSLYDEAYGPGNWVNRGGGGYSGGGSYDEGFIARRNSRDDAEAKERAEREQAQAKPKKKKKSK